MYFGRDKTRVEGATHDRSKGVVGCEEPPRDWAKLAIGPLFGRGFPRPALPIGTPPPKAQVAPFPAIISHTLISYSGPLPRHAFSEDSVPIFPL
jgi:hypothetical protein